MTLNEIMLSLELGIIYGIVSLGIYLTFRIIDFPDLTCDGSFVLGAVVVAVLLKSGFSIGIALISASISGGIAGYITGILHTKFKVSNLLSGILTSFMLYSINLRIMGMSPNISITNNNVIFTQYPIIGSIIVAIVLCAIVTYMLMTDFGLSLRTIGYNKILAEQYGVNTTSMIMLTLALSNVIIALGGGLFSLSQGFADVNSGIGTVIIGFASILIGEKILPYRNLMLQIFSCFIGSISYRLLISLALHSDILGLASSDLNLLTGILVILIMSIPQISYVSFRKY